MKVTVVVDAAFGRGRPQEGTDATTGGVGAATAVGAAVAAAVVPPFWSNLRDWEVLVACRESENDKEDDLSAMHTH